MLLLHKFLTLNGGLIPNHFQQEWRLRGQRRDSRSARLQRNLSNLLTDLGLLDSARRLTEASLTQQQASDDPEQFKTLGRLGEIQVRLGDYAAARASYQESWRRQPPDQREGRTAVYQYQNLSKATTKGVEAKADYWLNDIVNVWGNLAYIEGKDGDGLTAMRNTAPSGQTPTLPRKREGALNPDPPPHPGEGALNPDPLRKRERGSPKR